MCTGVGEKRYEVIDSVDSRLYPHKGSGALKEDAAGCATAWMRAAICTAMPTKATAFALNQCPTFLGSY